MDRSNLEDCITFGEFSMRDKYSIMIFYGMKSGSLMSQN